MCRTQSTISAYFSDGEVTCSLNDLRIDGTLREFADWQQVQDLCALDGTQIMELKRASLLFKRHENRTYESLQRKLDKPSNHPIHFAFATYQVDAAGIQRERNYATDVPKCKYCNAWLFPQEVSRTKWCCNEGAFTHHINQWTQPTTAFRDMCIGTSTNAKTFRTQCRALNNAYTFGSFAINYGEVCQLPIPSSLKINGIPYSLLFHGEVKCPLTFYIHDANYRHNPKLPESLTTVVTDCIFQQNDLANKLRVLGQQPNVDAWTLHIDINDAATASAGDVAGLLIKSSGADVNGRTLVIYPTQASFQRAHPTLETTRGENGLFVPSNHEYHKFASRKTSCRNPGHLKFVWHKPRRPVFAPQLPHIPVSKLGPHWRLPTERPHYSRH